MNQYYNEINRFIDAHKDEMVEKWKTLVNMEGHYDEKENVERAAGWLKNEFEQEGFQCRPAVLNIPKSPNANMNRNAVPDILVMPPLLKILAINALSDSRT